MNAHDEFEADITYQDLKEVFQKCILIKSNEESEELDADDLADISSLTRYLRWSFALPALATSINSLQRQDDIHGHISWWETVALATPFIKDKRNIPAFISDKSDKENFAVSMSTPLSLPLKVNESNVASKLESTVKPDSANSETDSTRVSDTIKLSPIEADLEQNFVEIDLNENQPTKLGNYTTNIDSSERLPKIIITQSQVPQASDGTNSQDTSTNTSPSKKGFFQSIRDAMSFRLSRPSSPFASPSRTPSGTPQTSQKEVTQNLQIRKDSSQSRGPHSPSRSTTSEGWSVFLSPRGQQQSQSQKSNVSQKETFSRADSSDSIEYSFDRQSIFSTEDVARSQYIQLNESRSSAGSFKPPKPQQSNISDGFRTPRQSRDETSEVDFENDTRRSQSPVKHCHDNSPEYDDYRNTLGSTLGSAESEINFDSALGPPDVRRSITGFRRSITSTFSDGNCTSGHRSGVGLSALIRAELQGSFNKDAVISSVANLEKSPSNSIYLSMPPSNLEFIKKRENLHSESFSRFSQESNNSFGYNYRMEPLSPSTGRARISLGSATSQNDAINRLKQMIQRSQEREKDDEFTTFNPYGGLLDQATSVEGQDVKFKDANCWEAYYNRSQPRCLQREKVESCRKQLLLSLNEIIPQRSLPFLYSQEFSPISPLLDHHNMISTKINHCAMANSSAASAISPEFSSPRGGLPCPPQLSVATTELSDHDLNLGVAFSGQVQRKTSRGYFAQRFMVLYGERITAANTTSNKALKPLPPSICLYSTVVQTAWGSVPIRPKSCILASDLLEIAIEDPKKVSRNLFQITARPWAGQSHLDVYLNSPNQPVSPLNQSRLTSSVGISSHINDTAALSAGENLKLVFAAPSALDRLSWIEWLQVARSNGKYQSQLR